MPRRERGRITPTMIAMLRKLKRRMLPLEAEWSALRRAHGWGLLRFEADIGWTLTLAGDLVLAAFDAGVRSIR